MNIRYPIYEGVYRILTAISAALGISRFFKVLVSSFVSIIVFKLLC